MFNDTRDLEINEVHRKLQKVSGHRKTENMQQRQAYKHLLEFIQQRAQCEHVMPGQNEIQIIEVFKKLVESGWIVREPEVLKVFQLAGITAIQVKRQKGLRSFLEFFIK